MEAGSLTGFRTQSILRLDSFDVAKRPALGVSHLCVGAL